jgi:hypothetical protein
VALRRLKCHGSKSEGQLRLPLSPLLPRWKLKRELTRHSVSFQQGPQSREVGVRDMSIPGRAQHKLRFQPLGFRQKLIDVRLPSAERHDPGVRRCQFYRLL